MASFAISRALTRPSARAATGQAIAGLVVAAAAAALTMFVTRRTAVNAAPALILVAGCLWFATTRRTHLALAVLMLYLGLLDGYLKLATGSNLVTFVRDALMYAIVFGLLLRAIVERKRLTLPPLSGWVLTFVVIVLVQIPNPTGGSLLHSLAGVRQHLEFVPLFFLAFIFVRTVRALRIFVILLAVIAAANGIAGYVQYRETPQQFAKWGPGYAQRVLATGGFNGPGRSFFTGVAGSTGKTLPFGLGSDAGVGGVFGSFAFAGILALAAFSVRRRYQLLAVVMALGAALAVITSQNRGVVVSTVIIVLAFVVLTARSWRRVTSLSGLVIAMIAALFVIQAVTGSAGSHGLRYQGLSPAGVLRTTNTARGKSISAIPHNLVTYPFGAGLGTAGPAATAPGSSAVTQSSTPPDTETEFSFLTIETGIPGMLAVTGFAITLLVVGLRRIAREPDREARVFLAAIIAPIAGILALFFNSALTVSVPDGPYLWAAGGIISYWLFVLPAARRQGLGPRAERVESHVTAYGANLSRPAATVSA
jgi:GNAT superfamily N-acetyltransferase